MKLLLFGLAVEPGSLAAIALRGLQDAAPLLVGVDRPLHACHWVFLLSFTIGWSGRRASPRRGSGRRGWSAVQQAVDALGVVGRHRGAAVEAPGSLGRLVLEQMPPVGLLANDLPGSGAPEPLRRPAVGLGF